MKIEARGKYPGVKVHLDGEEAQMFLDFIGNQTAIKVTEKANPTVAQFATKLGKKVQKLIGEFPNLLSERTPEQIKESLNGDLEKIHDQLAAMSSGKDWKKVK